MDGFVSWLRQLQFDGVWQTALLVAASLLCITFHETCHGLAAYRLGDPTAKRAGRLTLNPLRHVDIGGLLMMALFRFGWAKPVPVDMRNFKNPKRDMAITALAGPLANVVICCVFLFIYGLVYIPLTTASNDLDKAVLDMVYLTAYLSIALAVFNIIPISPLDGSKILFSFLSDESYMKLMRYERYGMILLLVLVVTDVLGTPLYTVTQFVFGKLFVFADWGFDLVKALYV